MKREVSVVGHGTTYQVYYRQSSWFPGLMTGWKQVRTPADKLNWFYHAWTYKNARTIADRCSENGCIFRDGAAWPIAILEEEND